MFQTFSFSCAVVSSETSSIKSFQKQGSNFVEKLGNGIELEMVSVPEGNFYMGASENEKYASASEYPRHHVRIRPFYMSKYPITQVQWRTVCSLQSHCCLSTNPSQFLADKYPVEQISWEDATEFCTYLSQETGRNYRLPTEAEWEYACRAGTSTEFHFGRILTPSLAKYQENSSSPSPVGSLGWSNAFGLCEMHGNVWELCQDHWHDNHKKAPEGGEARLKSGGSQFRVMKGGSWSEIPPNCRSACRKRISQNAKENHIGFRVIHPF